MNLLLPKGAGHLSSLFPNNSKSFILQHQIKKRKQAKEIANLIRKNQFVFQTKESETQCISTSQVTSFRTSSQATPFRTSSLSSFPPPPSTTTSNSNPFLVSSSPNPISFSNNVNNNQVESLTRGIGFNNGNPEKLIIQVVEQQNLGNLKTSNGPVEQQLQRPRNGKKKNRKGLVYKHQKTYVDTLS